MWGAAGQEQGHTEPNPRTSSATCGGQRVRNRGIPHRTLCSLTPGGGRNPAAGAGANVHCALQDFPRDAPSPQPSKGTYVRCGEFTTSLRFIPRSLSSRLCSAPAVYETMNPRCLFPSSIRQCFMFTSLRCCHMRSIGLLTAVLTLDQ
jgi:hypothetical protein